MKNQKIPKLKKNTSKKNLTSKSGFVGRGGAFDRKKNKTKSASHNKKVATSGINRKNKDLEKSYADFIASLAPKSELKNGPEAIEFKISFSKKYLVKKNILAFLFVIALGGVFWGGYLAGFSKHKRITLSEFKNAESVKEELGDAEQEKNENLSSVSAPEETVAQLEVENSSDIPVAEEIFSESTDGQQQQLVGYYNEDEKSIQLSEIALKILNKGAPSGSAKKVKNLLLDDGYAQIDTKDGQGADVIENTVFYKEDKFMREAQLIREILLNEEGIFSYARKAETSEEKSADIVIILGTLKEAPPN